MPRLSAAVALAAVTLTSACALSLRNPTIAELQDHPGRYQDHAVSVTGTVSSSWGVPLLPFAFYKVDDGTGEVTIVSQGARIPARGERVRVRGRLNELAVFGGRPIGLHLQEESLYVRR